MNYNRHYIFSLAWQMVRVQGMTMSDALKTAWANAKVVNGLRKGVCRFKFNKLDGTVREAVGTLVETLIPETRGTGRRRAESVQCYFDLQKNEWRCFRKDLLIGVA